jgi:hypothetical protein
MHRSLPLCLLLTLGAGSVALAQPGDAAQQHQSPTPAWLPRGAFLGTYLRNGAVVPQARLQWQLTLFQDRKDALAFVVDGGLGVAAALPDSAVENLEVPFKSFYAHTAMVGGAYRNHRGPGWHWGFQVTAGPVWFGADYAEAGREDRVGGLLEGRLHVGRQLGAAAFGVSVGYGEPFSVGRRSVAKGYIGGLLLGFFADWR